MAAEGSTNWSISGEGVFVLTGQPGGPGYKAQNNTQSVITDQDTVTRFAAELVAEHMAAPHAAAANPQNSNLKSPLPQKLAPTAHDNQAAARHARRDFSSYPTK